MERPRTFSNSPIDNPNFSAMGSRFFSSVLLRISVVDLNRACVAMRWASVSMASFLLGGWMGLNANPGKVLSDEIRQNTERFISVGNAGRSDVSVPADAAR